MDVTVVSKRTAGTAESQLQLKIRPKSGQDVKSTRIIILGQGEAAHQQLLSHFKIFSKEIPIVEKEIDTPTSTSGNNGSPTSVASLSAGNENVDPNSNSKQTPRSDRRASAGSAGIAPSNGLPGNYVLYLQ
jgi:hypothetical protein